MNRTLNFVLVLAVAVAGLSCTTSAIMQPGYDQPDSRRSVDTPSGYSQPGYGTAYSGDFYDALSPYGQWVRTPEYGNVWIPDVEPGFRPYASNGHWVVTEFGNTWVSDYNWGWAPFHYGRWYQDRFRGWVWVPGRDWGPAWVSWRSGGGYYGWAPLGPGAHYNSPYNVSPDYWVFVPQQYVTSPRLYNYCLPRQQVVTVYQHTTLINNVYRSDYGTYAYGPRRDELERVTRRSVPVYRIENTPRPGRDVVRDNSVGIYRPNGNRGGRSTYPGNSEATGRPEYRESYPNEGSRREVNPYPGSRGTDNRPDYRSRRGTYESNTPSAPAPQPRTPAYPESAPRRRYEPPAPTMGNPASGQTPERLESVPQPERPYRRGGGSYYPPINSQPPSGGGQARESRPGGYEQRAPDPAQQPAPQGAPLERRSRGPR